MLLYSVGWEIFRSADFSIGIFSISIVIFMQVSEELFLKILRNTLRNCEVVVFSVYFSTKKHEENACVSVTGQGWLKAVILSLSPPLHMCTCMLAVNINTVSSLTDISLFVCFISLM